MEACGGVVVVCGGGVVGDVPRVGGLELSQTVKGFWWPGWGDQSFRLRLSLILFHPGQMAFTADISLETRQMGVPSFL